MNNRPPTLVEQSGLCGFGESLGGGASDDDIRNNVCVTEQCGEEERRAGRRTAAEAQLIIAERRQVYAALNTLNTLIEPGAHNSGTLDLCEYERLSLAVRALWGEGDGGRVFIESSSVKGHGTRFDVEHDSRGHTRIFLPSGTRGILFAFGLAHEAQHVRDFKVWFGGGRGRRSGEDLREFDYEVRGFETEGIAAKAHAGLPRHPAVRGAVPQEILWDKSWAPADVHTLRRSGAAFRVTRDYAPLSAANPGPRFSDRINL